MDNDILLILGAYAIHWLTLMALLKICIAKKKVLGVNLAIQFVYSLLFIINFLNTGPGGGVLAVIVVWLVLIGIHWFVNLVQLVVKTNAQL